MPYSTAVRWVRFKTYLKVGVFAFKMAKPWLYTSYYSTSKQSEGVAEDFLPCSWSTGKRYQVWTHQGSGHRAFQKVPALPMERKTTGLVDCAIHSWKGSPCYTFFSKFKLLVFSSQARSKEVARGLITTLYLWLDFENWEKLAIIGMLSIPVGPLPYARQRMPTLSLTRRRIMLKAEYSTRKTQKLSPRFWSRTFNIPSHVRVRYFSSKQLPSR